MTDRSLERGRIVQSSPDGLFELWLSVHGTQTRLAEFATEEDAQNSYDKALTILKPAVHDPFNAGTNVRTTVTRNISPDQVNRLAMFSPCDPSLGASSAGGSTSGDGGSGSESNIPLLNSAAQPPVVRKIALKTLAAPPEEPSSKHRKLNSQKSLRSFGGGAHVRRGLGSSGGGGGRRNGGGGGGSEELQFKADLFYSDLEGGNDEGGVRLCALCGGGDDRAAALMGAAWDTKSLNDDALRDYDGQGHWLRGPLLLQRGQRGLWIHWTCAHYSPLALLGPKEEDESTTNSSSSSSDGGHGGSGATSSTPAGESSCWYNVSREVRRGRGLLCTGCGLRGATLGCTWQGADGQSGPSSCKANLHLPCSVALEGYRLPVPWLRDTNPFLCRKHAGMAAANLLATQEAGQERGGSERKDSVAAAMASDNSSSSPSSLSWESGVDVSGGQERNVAVTWSGIAAAYTATNSSLGSSLGSLGGSGSGKKKAITLVTKGSLLPSGFVYAVDPLFDPEVPHLGPSVLEMDPTCVWARDSQTKAPPPPPYTADGKLCVGDAGWKKAVVVECAPGARCHRSCPGRVVGRGMAQRLQIEPIKPLTEMAEAAAGSSSPSSLSPLPSPSAPSSVMAFVLGSNGHPSASSSNGSSPSPLSFPSSNVEGRGVDGWGVRLLLNANANGSGGVLPRGSFVCEFVGRVCPEARPDVAAALAAEDRRVVRVSEWLPQDFNPDALLSDTALDPPPLPLVVPALSSSSSSSSSNGGGGGSQPLLFPRLCMDARSVGNVARFIRVADASKGEKPNLLKQAVFTTGHNPYAPRLALFAQHDISAGAELLR